MDTNPILVAAIDFGTTYSGWAFSFLHEFESDPTKASVQHWNGGSIITEKTPTCLLVKPDGKTLEAFGYEAENRYTELAGGRKHSEYYYFRRFKMALNKKLGEKIDRKMKLEDEMGRQMTAIDVFSMAIKYLVDDMLRVATIRITGILKQSDIVWVLTVPAIWTDGAKQFMREAAEKAGIDAKKLKIAREPEGASLSCRHLSIETTIEKSDISVSKFKAGTRYMILDAGGGTVDITVHEVCESEKYIREVHSASGGGYGGTLVDKEFENMLVNIFGQNIYFKFKKEETEDWLDLWRDFEVKKRYVSPDKSPSTNMKFPASLIDIFEKHTGKSVEEAIVSSKYSNDVQLMGAGKLRFTANVMKSFFDNSVRNILDLVRPILKEIDVKAILMVGGYSESPVLQDAVRKAFRGTDVVIPLGASSTVLRGALIYGHSPESISERILIYTYGVRSSSTFREGLHLESKKVLRDSGYECTDIFDKHVEKNQIVKYGETQVTQRYTPTTKYQTLRQYTIYASDLKDPKYTDQGCFQVGTCNVEVSDPDDDLDRGMILSLTFSGPEIIVEAKDEKTGKKFVSSIDFLG